jgi:hypothetical protein
MQHITNKLFFSGIILLLKNTSRNDVVILEFMQSLLLLAEISGLSYNQLERHYTITTCECRKLQLDDGCPPRVH